MTRPNLVNWLETNALEPDRVKMIGSLWSPPDWMKITTGTLMNWEQRWRRKAVTTRSSPGAITAATPAAGVSIPPCGPTGPVMCSPPSSAGSKKPDCPCTPSAFKTSPMSRLRIIPLCLTVSPTTSTTPVQATPTATGSIYGDAVQALANELALHPEITTKFFGPELSQLGGGATNPYNLPIV